MGWLCSTGVGSFVSWSSDHPSRIFRYWVYALAISAAALVSQVAEWAHLTAKADAPWPVAYAYAMYFASNEYAMSVPSQRLGLKLTGSFYTTNLIWTAAQLISSYIVLYYESREPLSWRDWCAIALVVASVAIKY